jgi:methylase of polypeptide subunit release factors
MLTAHDSLSLVSEFQTNLEWSRAAEPMPPTDETAAAVPPTGVTLKAVQDAGEDFEWYPTTKRMIDVVARRIPTDAQSLMDIGAGDGRVLAEIAQQCRIAAVEREMRAFRERYKEKTPAEMEETRRDLLARERGPELYAIEKSTVLVQAQPETVTPVGTDLFEQNLACLPVDYIFSNPPYSQFETWASTIIESGYAKRAFLIIPQRWADSAKYQSLADEARSHRARRTQRRLSRRRAAGPRGCEHR